MAFLEEGTAYVKTWMFEISVFTHGATNKYIWSNMYVSLECLGESYGR